MTARTDGHTTKQKKVLTRALEWYALNIKAGCGRDNFTGQTRRLWDACAAAAKEARKK